jgi:pyruvate dehydrogenase E1 component subunit alpha
MNIGAFWAQYTAEAVAQPFRSSRPRLAGPVQPYSVLAADGEQRGDLPELSSAQLRDLYTWMLFGRLLDTRGLQLQRQGRIGVWGPMAGQEAAQAGLGLAMQPDDWLFPSYREAITQCMRGLRLADLLTYYRGLYWTADPHATGVFPIQILIGDQCLHAVGAGMAFALREEARVAVGVIGDGATSQGDFHEALNFAGVYAARSVLFIQNNHWAISVPRSRQTASQSLAQKALAYGLEGVLVDGNDALAVYAVSQWALEHARSGQGPVLVEALTYRMGAHTTADDPTRYQPPEELAKWQARDPLPRLRRYLERRGDWDEQAEAQAQQTVLEQLDAAIAESERVAPPPVDRIFETTCAQPTPRQREQQAQARA